MDEKGFAMGLVSKSKRVFRSSFYEKRRRPQSLQDGNGEWVTVLASVCADGTALPPGLFLSGKNNTIQSSWECHRLTRHQNFKRYARGTTLL